MGIQGGMMLIYHLTSHEDWTTAQNQPAYTAPSLEMEGFIHCSTAEQLLPVANAFYLEVEAPIVLVIDPERLAARLAWETPEGADPFSAEEFPHIYGPINFDAVQAIAELEKGEGGLYTGFD
jgi:uncharacterized protein (DUF952 family)